MAWLSLSDPQDVKTISDGSHPSMRATCARAVSTAFLHGAAKAWPLDVRFHVTDLVHEYPVRYSGILPDLFREGQSVIARGRIEGGEFIADEILAKPTGEHLREVMIPLLRTQHLEALSAQEMLTILKQHIADATLDLESSSRNFWFLRSRLSTSCMISTSS